MYINNEDYDLLCDIEIYLQKRNKKLFNKLWKLNERLKLQHEKNKNATRERVNAKRKLDKNYAR